MSIRLGFCVSTPPALLPRLVGHFLGLFLHFIFGKRFASAAFRSGWDFVLGLACILADTLIHMMWQWWSTDGRSGFESVSGARASVKLHVSAFRSHTNYYVCIAYNTY